MGSFTNVINDVMGVLRKAIMINTLLNTVILFLILYIFFTLINLIPLILSLVLSLIYLIYVWAKKVRLYTIGMVEDKFPDLKDKLTTAKDTVDSDNYVVTKLRVEVTKRLRDTEAGDIFNYTKLMFKIIVIVLLIFLIIFVTVKEWMIFDAEAAIAKLKMDFKFGGSESNAGDGKEGNSTGLEFQVPKTIDYNDIDNADAKNFKKEEFLSYDELNAIGAQEYNDPITEEEKEIVKSYFDKINQR
jgi:hypothetical protein